MKKYFIVLLILFTHCTILGSTEGMDAQPPQGTPSVADYGLFPSLDVTQDAGVKLTSIIKNNSSIHIWFIPKGEYNFKTLKLSDFNGKVFYGDPKGNTIFRFNKAEEYPKNIECHSVKNLTFYNITWANVRMSIKGSSENIKFDSNIFYDLVYNGTTDDNYPNKSGKLNDDYFLQFGEYSGNPSTDNITIKNSVFLRSQNKFEAYKNSPVLNHQTAAAQTDEYMKRRQYGIRFATVSDVVISDNIFGLRTTEINKALSFAKTADLKSTITRASSLMVDKAGNPADQVYFTTAINTVPNVNVPTSVAQNLKIVNNLFNGWFSRSYATESLVTTPNGMPRGGDNRFFDHAAYLRGTKNVLFAGNLIRGWANDASGGLKLKSGINIAIINNSFENTGIILVRSKELDKTFSNMLVMNNYLKLNDATGSYTMGITFDECFTKGDKVNENHSSYDSDGIEEMLKRLRYIVVSGNRISQKNIQTTWIDGTLNPANNVTLLRLNDRSPDLYTKRDVNVSQEVHDSKIQIHDNRYDNPTGERIIENRQTTPLSFEYTETPFNNLHPEAMNLYKNERNKYNRPKVW